MFVNFKICVYSVFFLSDTTFKVQGDTHNNIEFIIHQIKIQSALCGAPDKEFSSPMKMAIISAGSTRNRPFVFPPWTEPPGSPRAALTMQMCTICSHYGKPHRNQTAILRRKTNININPPCVEPKRPPSGPHRAFWHAIITDFRGSFISAVARAVVALNGLHYSWHSFARDSRPDSVNSCENATFVEAGKLWISNSPTGDCMRWRESITAKDTESSLSLSDGCGLNCPILRV